MTQNIRRILLNPNVIILGSVLFIIAIIGIMLAAAKDDSSTRLVVVPDTDWLPRGENFTPEFTLPGFNTDGDVSLADFRGQYVLINFWASWCPPCNKEMPDLQAYYDVHRDQNFTLLAVNVQEEIEVVESYMAEHGYNFPVALDETGTVYERYGGNGLPSSYLVDPAGNIVKAWRPGALSPEMLAEDVTPLLRG